MQRTIYLKCKERLSEACFNLHKSESNSTDLKDFVNGQTSDTHKTKILVLLRYKSNYTFVFDMKDLKKLIVMNPTKREFIQFFASTYGPLGFINECVYFV